MIDNSLDFSEERMTEVALGAIGKIPLQDLINDAVLALIELYKAKPEIYQIDTDQYEATIEVEANPFTDIVAYLQEINTPTESLDESD